MNESDPIPLHRSTVTAERHRWMYPAALIAVGAILAGLHVPHIRSDVLGGQGLLALVTGAVFPLVLSLVIASAGYWLWRSDLQAPQLRRVDMWFALGIVAFTAVSGTIGVYQLLEGAHLTHIPFALLNFATVGGLGGIIVGWYDVQNRRRAEQLRVFKRLVEDGGHSVCLTAPDGTIEFVNSAFEEQTGYDRETAVGRTPRILKSGEQDEAFYAEMWETITAGDVWRHELINGRKDGTTYAADQTIAPVTDRDGTIEHFVAINVDVSERKRYERELERQNERLDQFASVVSHDLRNPLNVAINRVQLAERECDSEHLPIAAESLDRMTQLIEDVLTLTRQGDDIGEPTQVSLRSVSQDAWDHVEAPEADLSVRSDLTIRGDDSRLQQLLENLFRNAVEHGGDDVTIRVGECGGGFYVEDSGAGFPDDEPEQLFESGYTTADQGTGLGLAIAGRIVDAHDWSISATTGADGGARFEITGVTTHSPAAKAVGGT